MVFRRLRLAMRVMVPQSCSMAVYLESHQGRRVDEKQADIVMESITPTMGEDACEEPTIWPTR
jgi:hypothetical protein